jgi:hypothetical protein
MCVLGISVEVGIGKPGIRKRHVSIPLLRLMGIL